MAFKKKKGIYLITLYYSKNKYKFGVFNMTDFEKLFNPRAIGIIGASDKRAGRFFIGALLHIGFEKPIYLFNPKLKGKTIEEIRRIFAKE